MSLEYPPTTIAVANTWIKDLNDSITGYVSNSSTQSIASYKTTVSGSTYGNGEYKAWTNDIWEAYTHTTTYATGEWPASGAFDKSEGDSNTQLSSHTGRTYSDSSDKSPAGDLVIEMPDRIKLTSYSIKNRPGYQGTQAPKKWTLSGRTGDGDSWTTIETRSVSSWTSGETKTFTVSPSEYYSDYKISWLRAMAYGSSISIYTVKYYGTPWQMTTPIRFDRLGNLPFTRTSIYNKTTSSAITLEHGLKDLADIENTTVMSLDLLQDPTMYNGKFYVPDSGTHTEYFPSEFSTTPGVFFTLEWDVWGSGTGTRKNLVITSVTTKYFTITNPQSDMDPIVHWMAVKPGTGNIYGKNYKCEVVSSGGSWGTNRTFTYSSMGNDPYAMYCVNSRNNGSNVYNTSLNAMPTSTQTTFCTGVNDEQTVTNNQTVSSSEQLAYLVIQNSGDVTDKMYMWTGTEKSVAYDVHTTTTNGAALQNAICLGIVRNTGGNSLTLYANRLTNKRVKWYIKEYVGRDGTHGAETTLMLQMAGTTTNKAKPFWHLCANHLNAVQGVSANSHVDRWYNLSQRAFKYAVGRTESGSQKPTLKSDSNGYYVNFNNTNQEYFDIPVPVTWKFADTDGVGTKGITAFCVMKFTDTSQSWSRFFDFGNGSGIDNVLWAKNGTSTNMRLEGHQTETLPETKNGSTYYKSIDEGTSNFGGTIYNNAQKKSGYVELTTAGNSQNGQIQWSDMNPGNRLYATFDSWTGGGNGADATWFYWGCTTRPTKEDFNSGGYLLAIDEYGTNEIQLEFNNSRLQTKVIGNIDDSTWHSWIVEYKNNTITVWRDGTEQFSKVDTSRTLSTLVGWGARTGGATNRHLVKNMKVWVSSEDGTGYSSSNTVATYDSTNSPITTNWAVYTARYNNCDKTAKFWVDNIGHTPNETETTTLTDRTTTINYIGNSNWASDAEMHSSMREQIVYDDTLTDDQVSDINLHLCEKWGI
tara:strand:+ start:7939 stop:10866 length:2928 start_codon:yes stop_codon:yes gene_type:complete